MDGLLRNGHQADEVGQVLDGALQPAGLREAARAPGLLGEEAVGEAGRRQGGAQVVGLANSVRVAEGDGGFDDAPVGGHLQPEAGPGLRFDGARGHVLGLDHHGCAAGRGDDDVGAQPRVAGDGLGVLGAHAAAGQHGLQQPAEGVVGAGLSMAWHCTCSIIPVNRTPVRARTQSSNHHRRARRGRAALSLVSLSAPGSGQAPIGRRQGPRRDTSGRPGPPRARRPGPCLPSAGRRPCGAGWSRRPG